MALDPTEADVQNYRAVHTAVRQTVDRLTRAHALEHSSPRLASLLMRLRMACNHPALAADAAALHVALADPAVTHIRLSSEDGYQLGGGTAAQAAS